MAFWSNWSDGKKWFMGIISALIVAVLVKQLIGGGSHPGRESVDPGTSISNPPSQVSPETSTDLQKKKKKKKKPKNSPPLQTSSLEQKANDFNFILKGCEPDGSDLRCRITVTNKRETRKLMI